MKFQVTLNELAARITILIRHKDYEYIKVVCCVNIFQEYLYQIVRKPKTSGRITRRQGIISLHRGLVNKEEKQTLKLQNFKQKSKFFNSDNFIKSIIITIIRRKSKYLIYYMSIN